MPKGNPAGYLPHSKGKKKGKNPFAKASAMAKKPK